MEEGEAEEHARVYLLADWLAVSGINGIGVYSRMVFLFCMYTHGPLHLNGLFVKITLWPVRLDCVSVLEL